MQCTQKATNSLPALKSWMWYWAITDPRKW